MSCDAFLGKVSVPLSCEVLLFAAAVESMIMMACYLLVSSFLRMGYSDPCLSVWCRYGA